MCRQISVSNEDCDTQRIVWKASPGEPLKTYRLLTVMYGTTSASFMTTRCLIALTESFEKQFPVACKAIKQDFYMDDLMTGSNSEEEVFSLQQNISTILNSAKLLLHKWCSTSSSLLKQIGDADMVKSLRLLWKPFSDEFRFYVMSNPKINRLSKRVLLSNTKKDYLSVCEIREAEMCILKQIQNDAFWEEIQSLKSKKELKARSKLRCLHPFLKDGLILVGGRLNNSNLIYKRRHPIVLPGYHKVTRLIFEQNHHEQLHCGPQALLAEARRKYWPLRGRVVARSVVLKCVKCTRGQPRFNELLMVPLPKQRVKFTRPFAITGIDFAGPIIIRSSIRRVICIKAWIAVFVCFTTRAIHLEAVEDLSS